MQHHFLWKKEKKINHILIRRRVPSTEPQANNYRHSDLSHFGWVVQGLVTCDNYDWVNVSWLVLLQSVIADLSFFLFSFFFSFFLSHGKISKWKRYHTFTSALTLIINLISKIDPLHKKKYALQIFYSYFDKEKQIGSIWNPWNVADAIYLGIHVQYCGITYTWHTDIAALRRYKIIWLTDGLANWTDRRTDKMFLLFCFLMVCNVVHGLGKY